MSFKCFGWNELPGTTRCNLKNQTYGPCCRFLFTRKVLVFFGFASGTRALLGSRQRPLQCANGPLQNANGRNTTRSTSIRGMYHCKHPPHFLQWVLKDPFSNRLIFKHALIRYVPSGTDLAFDPTPASHSTLLHKNQNCVTFDPTLPKISNPSKEKTTLRASHSTLPHFKYHRNSDFIRENIGFHAIS